VNVLLVGPMPPHHPGGGAAVFNAELLQGLARLGHCCRAIAPLLGAAGFPTCHGRLESLPHSTGDASCAPEVAEIPVSHYSAQHFPLSSDDFFRSAELQEQQRRAVEPMLHSAIASERPDVIVLGRDHFSCDVPALAAAHAIPTLLITHSGNLAKAVLDASFSEAQARQIITQRRSISCIVAVARHVAAAWQKLGLDNVRTILNTVDCHDFAPRPKNRSLLRSLNIADDDIVVAHVSNMHPCKRLGDVARAAARALRKNRKLVFVLVGDGPDRSAAIRLADEQAILQHFRFVGWVPRRQVADYLNLADIVVMPSAIEALSLAVLEAQASGKLVLASDIPGNRELIVDGETGLLFPVSDVQKLADKMLRAASDRQLREQLGERAHQLAQQRSRQGMIEEYDSVLRELLFASQ
jgi:glycosyltransferase involved in cell wall biosynthesis